MLEINRSFKINNLFDINLTKTLETQEKEVSLLEQGGGLDIVSFSGNKSEKFADVRAEMDKNVPDRTTTLSEKQLAASYIKRMILCDDIPADLKNYWSNKRDILEMEALTIINKESTANNDDWQQIAEEWNFNTSMYWNKEAVFENVPDRVEYYRSYYNMYISFCDRMLACANLPDDVRSEWTKMRNDALFDLKNHLADLERYNEEQNR